MPFENYYRYGPSEGEYGPSQRIGFADNQLKYGDVAAPGNWMQSHPDAQARFKSGNPYYVNVPTAPQPGPYNGQYRVADRSMFDRNTPTSKWEFWLPKEGFPSQSATPSPGTVTDNPFSGGYPQMPQNPAQSPGGITDNPFAGGYPVISDILNPAPNEGMMPIQMDRYLYPNVPVNDFTTPISNDQYFPSASAANLPPNEGMMPAPVDQYFPSNLGTPTNVPTNEAMSANPIADILNPAPDETMSPTPISGLNNPPPNETMVPESNNFYYPAGDGTYVSLDSNGKPTGTLPTQQNEFAGIPTINQDLLDAQSFAGQPNMPPIGSFGVPGGNWFGDLPGIYSGPLPGANIPSYFGSSNLMAPAMKKPGSGSYGYGWSAGGMGGGTAGGHAAIPTAGK